MIIDKYKRTSKNIYILWLLLLIITMYSCVQRSAFSETQIHEFPKINEKYYYFKHESGLDIYVTPSNHEDTAVYVWFAPKYGTMDVKFRLAGEKEYTVVPDGTPYFLQNVIFEPVRGSLITRWEEAGARTQVPTIWSDMTCFNFSCKTDTNFEEQLEILFDYVMHPDFSDSAIQKAHEKFEEYRDMFAKGAYWQVFFGQFEGLYHQHPVKIESFGTVESVKMITTEMLRKCYDVFYNPHNMVICVCGRTLTVERVKMVADKMMRKSTPVEIERFRPAEPTSIAKERVEKRMEVPEPWFMIAFKDNDVNYDGDRMAKKGAEIDIVAQMLFGNSSKFYSRIDKDLLLKHPYLGIRSDFDYSYGHIYVTGISKDPEKVFAAVKAEVANAQLAEKDFEDCKRVIYENYMEVFTKKVWITEFFVLAKFDNFDCFDMPEIIESVTFEDVKKRFEMMFKPEKCALSVVYPI